MEPYSDWTVHRGSADGTSRRIRCDRARTARASSSRSEFRNPSVWRNGRLARFPSSDRLRRPPEGSRPRAEPRRSHRMTSSRRALRPVRLMSVRVHRYGVVPPSVFPSRLNEPGLRLPLAIHAPAPLEADAVACLSAGPRDSTRLTSRDHIHLAIGDREALAASSVTLRR